MLQWCMQLVWSLYVYILTSRSWVRSYHQRAEIGPWVENDRSTDGVWSVAGEYLALQKVAPASRGGGGGSKRRKRVLSAAANGGAAGGAA